MNKSLRLNLRLLVLVLLMAGVSGGLSGMEESTPGGVTTVYSHRNIDMLKEGFVSRSNRLEREREKHRLKDGLLKEIRTFAGVDDNRFIIGGLNKLVTSYENQGFEDGVEEAKNRMLGKREELNNLFRKLGVLFMCEGESEPEGEYEGEPEAENESSVQTMSREVDSSIKWLDFLSEEVICLRKLVGDYEEIIDVGKRVKETRRIKKKRMHDDSCQ